MVESVVAENDFKDMREFERSKVKLRECPPPGNPLVLEGRVELESEMPPAEDLWLELPQRSSLYSLCPSTSQSTCRLTTDQRLQALYTLICEEKIYNFNLNLIITEFAEPVRSYGLLNDVDFNLLFDPVYEMCSTSSSFISQLESLFNRWNSASSIVGHLFNEQLIGLFLSYHSHFASAKRLLRRKRHSESGFSRFCRQKCPILNTSLEELLLSPERRVLDYQEWLDTVMNRTPTEHPDMPQLKRAVQLLSDSSLLERSRDQVSRTTNEQRIEKVENSFPGANLQLLPRSISSSATDPSEVVTRRRPKSLPGRRQMVFRSKVPLFTSPSQTVMSQGDVTTKESFKRSYIKEGPAILTAGLQSHERYLFLFNDILLVAKEKERVANSYKLKEKIRLCEVWLKPDGMEEVAESIPQPSTSFVIGWPTANYVIQFSTPLERDGWYQILTQNVAEERFREFPHTTTMRVVCKDVRYESTHTLQVTNSQTAQDLLKRTAQHFGLTSEGDFQLWVDSGKENAPYPLYGHEIPFEILMSHYRDAVADGTVENANPADLASLRNSLKCQFVLRPKRGHKKLKMTRKSATNIVTQIRKRMMSKSDSADSGLLTGPTGKLFGHHLSTLSPDNSVPHPIMALLRHLLVDGLYCKGIFRQTPKASTVRELRERLDSGETIEFGKISPYVSASVLKEFFRSLPDCLLSSDKFQTWLQLAELDDYPVKIAKTKQLLGQLAKANYELLRHLVCLLKQIAMKHQENQMTSMNLAICFGYSLLWPAVEINIGDNCKRVPEVTQFLIERCVELFGEETMGLLGTIPEKCQSSQDSGEESDTNSSSRPSSSLHATSKNLSRDSGLADAHLGTDESEASVPRSFSQSDDTEEDFYPPQRSTRGAKSAENIPQATNIVIPPEQQKTEGPKSVTLDRRRSKNFSKDPNGADKSRPEFSTISSTDSLYNSFEFAGNFDSRLAPLRNSKRATVGTLHRSESGGHLVISESLELTLEKSPESRNLTLTVPIDTVDSANVSPLSTSERSDCLSPDFLTRNPPELTRNSLGRKPARHRKGPAPNPPQTSPSESDDFTSSMSSLNSSPSHYNSSEPLSPSDLCCSSIVLSCNSSPTTNESPMKVILVESERKDLPKAVVTQSIQLSAPVHPTPTPSSRWGESKSRLTRISTTGELTQRVTSTLPFRITVPNGQDPSEARVLQGSALYSTPLTKTTSTLEVPRKLSSASMVSCNTTGEFINDSSTMTESTSSDESTPHVSRENSRAQEYEHKVPVVQKSAGTISDRLASLLKESGRTPVIQRAKVNRDQQQQDTSIGYSSTSVLMKSTSTGNASVSGQQTFYVSKTGPLNNGSRTRLPTYQEAVNNRNHGEECRPTARGDTRMRDLVIRCPRSLSSTSSSESNTSSIDLDSPPPELTPNNRSTPTAPVVSRSPTSQNSQVLARIRRYDRENLRRKTLGGLDYLQAAKAHQEATISRPPVARTTSCERISPRPSSQTFGDLDLMPSWSVRKLREIYSRNANGSIQPADVTQMKQPQGKFHYDKNVRRERLYESYSSSNVVGGLVKATPVQIEVSDSRANYPVVYAPPLASETAKSHYQLRLKSASNLQHTDSNNNNTATTKSPVKRTERQNPDSYCSARQSNSRTINNTREPESYV